MYPFRPANTLQVGVKKLISNTQIFASNVCAACGEPEVITLIAGNVVRHDAETARKLYWEKLFLPQANLEPMMME